MIQQRGRRVICIGGASISISEIASDVPVSFKFFETLYLEGRGERFRSYIGAIYFWLSKIKDVDSIRKFNEINHDEETFNAQAHRYIRPSFLIQCAAQANYWEAIDLLVRKGGTIENFSRLAIDAPPMKTEWIKVYKRAYKSHIREQIHQEMRFAALPASSQRKEPTKESSSSDFVSNYLR
ncbi:MAG: hypothetical protein IT584_01175 [Chlamydiae bacterium]|nr:hypothetical protein [Chlamydiota bacterium]